MVASVEQFERYRRDPKADGYIVECVYDRSLTTVEYHPDANEEPTWNFPRSKPGGWKILRIRTDKKLPNDIKVVHSIEKSVADGITQPALLQALRLQPLPPRGAQPGAQPST